MAEVQLAIVEGPNTGREFDLSGSVVVGRDSEAGIVLDDAEASRRHVSLLVEGSSVTVEDLGSTNGTFINGDRIHAPRTVANGDRVRIGTTVLEVRSLAQATRIGTAIPEEPEDAQATRIGTRIPDLPPEPEPEPQPPVDEPPAVPLTEAPPPRADTPPATQAPPPAQPPPPPPTQAPPPHVPEPPAPTQAPPPHVPEPVAGAPGGPPPPGAPGGPPPPGAPGAPPPPAFPPPGGPASGPPPTPFRPPPGPPGGPAMPGQPPVPVPYGQGPPGPGAYPIEYEADYPEAGISRWRPLFQVFLAIPQLFALAFVALGMCIAFIGAWFVIVFTRRYPPGIFDFVGGTLRWSARVNGFTYLMTEQYPPFATADDPGYPVRARFAYPEAGISRWRPFFQGILALPHFVALWFVAIGAIIMFFVAWWSIIFTRTYPPGIFNFIAGFQRWNTRVAGYTLLMTEEYPPFSLD